MEHSPCGTGELYTLLLAAKSVGIPALVRVPVNDEMQLKKVRAVLSKGCGSGIAVTGISRRLWWPQVAVRYCVHEARAPEPPRARSRAGREGRRGGGKDTVLLGGHMAQNFS